MGGLPRNTATHPFPFDRSRLNLRSASWQVEVSCRTQWGESSRCCRAGLGHRCPGPASPHRRRSPRGRRGLPRAAPVTPPMGAVTFVGPSPFGFVRAVAGSAAAQVRAGEHACVHAVHVADVRPAGRDPGDDGDDAQRHGRGHCSAAWPHGAPRAARGDPQQWQQAYQHQAYREPGVRRGRAGAGSGRSGCSARSWAGALGR